MRPVPLQQPPHITILAQRALSLAPEAISSKEGMPLEASSEAEAGMPTPLTAATVTSATIEAAAFRTAAEATEAVRRGGRGAAPEAAIGLAGSRSTSVCTAVVTDLVLYPIPRYLFIRSPPEFLMITISTVLYKNENLKNLNHL